MHRRTCPLLLATAMLALYATAENLVAAENKPQRSAPINDWRVELPKEIRPLPEPLPEGQKPGFKIRGIKGLAWTPDQYLKEIPVLAKYKMNFLMNCYLSLFNETARGTTHGGRPEKTSGGCRSRRQRSEPLRKSSAPVRSTTSSSAFA